MLHHTDQRMLRLSSLQDHRTPLIPSSGTSANLYHQLISPLVRPEVREIHQAIGTQDSDHADIPEIQSLRQHLGTNQDLCLPLLEIRDDPLVSRAGTGRIEIQPLHLRRRELPSDLLLYLLCTETLHLELRPLTLGTYLRQAVSITAIMANQLVMRLVISKANVAIHAMRHPPAPPTLDHRGESPAVLEQDRLLTPG